MLSIASLGLIQVLLSNNPLGDTAASYKDSMSLAKKSIILFGCLLALVAGTAFIAARITAKNPATPFVDPVKSAPESLGKRPFFYSTIGTSNPHSIQAQFSQSLQKYTVHIRSFYQLREAEDLLKKLHNAGFFAYYTPVRQDGHVQYHVRLGIYSDAHEAEKSVGTLQKKLALKGSVTHLQ